ncbi:MAG: hypothetical protein Q9157_000852 [Trypethelium eluteriae]
MNLSGAVHAFRILREPSLCLPHASISNFRDLPIPLSLAFNPSPGQKSVDIRAVVLDKDNCFAIPHENAVHEPYNDTFQRLRKAYTGSRLLIVSNTAGTPGTRNKAEASLLEHNTGVKVLHHNIKKPGCGHEILQYFRDASDAQIIAPSQIAVVGDRLLTDVLMANTMGWHALWVKDGVVERKGLWAHLEHGLAAFLTRRGYEPPEPHHENWR